MDLIPWSYSTQHGFTLRGFYTPPSGKAVLHILHGNGYCSRMYQPFLAQLLPYFDLFLSDAQGHGDSDHGGVFIGWNQSADLALDAFFAHRHFALSQTMHQRAHHITKKILKMSWQ